MQDAQYRFPDRLKKDLPDIRPGMTVRVHQKITEGEKSRVQVFEGLVIARKGGKGLNGTVTVRKVSGGIAVEKIFPLHLPTLEKVEVVKSQAVRRAKLYHLRKPAARPLT
jgi:large subunit ribosomal protein L19